MCRLVREGVSSGLPSPPSLLSMQPPLHQHKSETDNAERGEWERNAQRRWLLGNVVGRSRVHPFANPIEGF
jgi:hypothetical protein